MVTAPAGTSIEDAEAILQARKIDKNLPLIDKQGRLSGLITIKDIEKVVEFPHAAKDARWSVVSRCRSRVTSDTFERAQALLDAGVDVIVIHTATGR